MTYFLIIVAGLLFGWFFGPTLFGVINTKRRESEIRALTRKTIKDMNDLRRSGF